MKYTETRSESLHVRPTTAATSCRSSTLAADQGRHGHGLKVDLLANMGAYIGLVGAGIPVLGALMFNAIYKMEAYQFNCTTVLTNKTWTDAYRGAGRPEATFAIERIMDELAAELGVDPLEIREKNWITHDEFPFTTVAGLTYDSGNYEAATAKAAEMFGYDELRREQQAAARPQGPGPARHRRLDVHRDVRPRAVAGPRRAEVRRRRLGARHDPDAADRQGRGRHGHVAARPGPRDGVEPDRGGQPRRAVRGRRGPARRHPIAPKGLDTYGSRSLVVGGEAVVKAADKVIEKAKPSRPTCSRPTSTTSSSALVTTT